jgi:hypothetical protein
MACDRVGTGKPTALLSSPASRCVRHVLICEAGHLLLAGKIRSGTMFQRFQSLASQFELWVYRQGRLVPADREF